ncbi:MAG: hypothetical protein AB7S75_24490 [Desulfococcaceae bacterium]
MEANALDTVTQAIAAASAAGAQQVGTAMISDLYKGLKALLVKKFGAKSDVTEAVEKLEKKPDSPARKAAVAEEVQAAKADKDQDIVKAAEKLLTALREQPGGEQIIQGVAVGERGVFVAGNVGKNIVTGDGNTVL